MVGGRDGPSGTSYAAAVVSSLDKGRQAVEKTTWMKVRSPGRRREDNYWECRKALRLRPIGPGDPIDGVKKFMVEHLKLSTAFMESVGQFSVRRVPCGPSARIQDEVVVAYQSTEVRDAVKSAARNLAGKGQSYGVRLEFPDHQKTAMNSLQALSYDIKQKHPHAKRNVLFDDGNLDLVLDFCVNEDQWRRVTSAQARGRKKKTPGNRLTVKDAELDVLLESTASGSTPGEAEEEEEQP